MTASYFDRFWQAYPKRVGKGAASKAFDKLEVDEKLHHLIIGAINDQKRSRKSHKADGTFLPPWCHPATWLNQQRWLDEVSFVTEFSEHKKKSCDICSEDAAVTRKGKSYCVVHWDFGRWKNQMKTQMKETGHWKQKIETVEEWQMRCKKEFFDKGYDKKVGMG